MVGWTVTLPNIITIGRLILVPLVIAAIGEDRLDIAFWLFVIAGASDGVDGYIARRWNLRTDLGAYLDAVADKVLLVAIYVALAIQHDLPRWLAILVVSRDLLIVGAILLSWVMAKPVEVRPLMVSKWNTLAQIVLAATVLGLHAFGIADETPRWLGPAFLAVGTLTVISGGAYLVGWLRAMSA